MQCESKLHLVCMVNLDSLPSMTCREKHQLFNKKANHKSVLKRYTNVAAQCMQECFSIA